MALKTRILDGLGHGHEAEVTAENALLITQYPCPPLMNQKNKVFRQYLTNDGTSSGSNDMGVDGSTVNQLFYITADGASDRYITTLNFIVGYGTTGGPYQWADGAALTNGSQLFYERIDDIVYIHDAIKANQDLMRLGVVDILPTAWEVRNLQALNDYGYMITIRLERFVPPYGVKLDMGTDQRLVFKIRDNATNADTFNCIAYGFDRFP